MSVAVMDDDGVQCSTSSKAGNIGDFNVLVIDNSGRYDIRDVFRDGTPRNLVIEMETGRKCRCHNNDI